MRSLKNQAERPALTNAGAHPDSASYSLAIGEVARRTGFAPSALRYYEALGLLGRVERHGGRRLYSTTTLDRLRLVRTARRAGFTLDEILGLLPALQLGRKQRSAARRAIAGKKIAELDETIATLASMRALLVKLLECECTGVERCDLLRD